MSAPSSESGKRGGFAVIYCALLSLLLAGMIGLCVDGTASYLVRLKLSQATDAAVLAGVRSLSVDIDVNSQASTAAATAQRYFDANIATGQWGITSVTREVTVTDDLLTRTRIVHATASAVAPLYFLNVLNRKSVTVGAVAEARRRDANVMLVLDRSGSMGLGNAIEPMKSAAQSFTNRFSSGRDQVGLVVFSGTYLTAFNLSTTFKTASPSLSSLIAKITSQGSTGTAQALWSAYQSLLLKGSPGAVNAIVLFTDGNPTAITADFNLLLSAGSTCSSRLTPKIGFIADYNGGIDPGPTAGVLDTTAVSISDGSENKFASGTAGCYFSRYGWPYLRNDIARMPALDYFGNSTVGYLPVNLASVDLPSQIQAAAKNATDDAARRIRRDPLLKPIIYVIGLGGTGPAPPDEVLMKRLANDTSSSAYSSLEATGLYVYSPNYSQLDAAFQRIASEITRLSQ